MRRCLFLFQSGRNLLQHLADAHDIPIRVSTFFESLKRARRLALLDECGGLLKTQMRHTLSDTFAAIASLDDFELWASSPLVKTNQARLLCLTHNLLTLLENTLLRRKQIANQPERARREKTRQLRGLAGSLARTHWQPRELRGSAQADVHAVV